MFLLPCRLCGYTPEVPKMWADASGNHSEAAEIVCKCGVVVVEKLQNRYAAKQGDTGWSMLYGDFDISLKVATEKWNNLHEIIHQE